VTKNRKLVSEVGIKIPAFIFRLEVYAEDGKA
jgi:hypothetical protein